MALGHAQVFQQRDTILSELRHRVTVVWLAAAARAATIENNRSEPLREKRHNADVPCIRGPPRSRHEEHRLSVALFFVVHLDITKLRCRHQLKKSPLNPRFSRWENTKPRSRKEFFKFAIQSEPWFCSSPLCKRGLGEI